MANGTNGTIPPMSLYNLGPQTAGVLSAPRLAAAPGPAPAAGQPLNVATAGIHVPLWLLGLVAGYFLLGFGSRGVGVPSAPRLRNPGREARRLRRVARGRRSSYKWDRPIIGRFRRGPYFSWEDPESLQVQAALDRRRRRRGNPGKAARARRKDVGRLRRRGLEAERMRVEAERYFHPYSSQRVLALRRRRVKGKSY